MDNKDFKLIRAKMQNDDSVLKALYLRSLGEAASDFNWDEPKEADGVPILARPRISSSDANIRISHDLFNLIAKEKAGYFASNIKRTFADGVAEPVKDKYTDFDRFNSMRKKLKSLAVSCASWGAAYSLCRLSSEGKNVLFDEVPAYSAMILKDRDGRPSTGYIYTQEKETLHIKEYDATNVYTYKAAAESFALVDTKAHGFREMPLIEWLNDETKQGNSERSVSLIDAYDLMVSDNSTEQAAFRNAYLLLSNLGTIDEAAKASMKKTGVIVGDGENAKAEFVTKDINPEFAQLVMETVWQNIFVVSSTVDTKALTSLSNATAFQISQIYRNLENDSQNTELEWRESLEYLDRVLKSFWTTLDTRPIADYNTYDIDYEFKRNKPKDTLSDLEAVKRAGGVIPNYEILRRSLDIGEETARELAEEAGEDMTAAMPSIE